MKKIILLFLFLGLSQCAPSQESPYVQDQGVIVAIDDTKDFRDQASPFTEELKLADDSRSQGVLQSQNFSVQDKKVSLRVYLDRQTGTGKLIKSRVSFTGVQQQETREESPLVWTKFGDGKIRVRTEGYFQNVQLWLVPTPDPQKYLLKVQQMGNLQMSQGEFEVVYHRELLTQ